MTHLDQRICDFIVKSFGGRVRVVAAVEGESLWRSRRIVQVGQGTLVDLRVHEHARLKSD